LREETERNNDSHTPSVSRRAEETHIRRLLGDFTLERQRLSDFIVFELNERVEFVSVGVILGEHANSFRVLDGG
jgi:hypothetical protein